MKRAGETWTAEQYREYLRSQKEPGHVVSVDGELQERTVKEVNTGRHHRKLVKRSDLGITFDSLTEERRYDFLKAQSGVLHIDPHPLFQLPHGIRYQADFLVYFGASVRVEDVKSKRGVTTEFRRLKAIFDDAHPFSPLYVVQYVNGNWEMTR